jgi:hypothetical protein
MIRNPFVRVAFERAEHKRDNGHAVSELNRGPRPLEGGTAERIPDPTEDQAASLSPRHLAVAYA